jgi:asparagine synthase (glutamine-hydrolysing)
MCGIAGAAGLIDQSVVAAVHRMNDAQVHRGPDDAGTWTSSQGQAFEVALAHRRLAILDLSPAGAQPMHNPGTGDVLVFNGEIYNFKELRDELARGGARFVSQSDTEVILRAYEAWGPDALPRLRGIFAFGLWDARRRTLYLARDPMGVKPLYWTRQGKTVLFASELRALLAAGVPRKLNPAGVASFLWHGFVVGPQTILNDVELLPAGSAVSLREGALQPQPSSYWRLPPAAPGRATPESVAAVLRETVKMQLVSDVPLGICLSGGVDSTAIATLARKTAHADVRTFTLGFEEPDLDESRQAALVAEMLGTTHASLRFGESDFRRQIPGALEAVDQPTFDGINSYLLSRAMRLAGMTVALAGTGGDELFGGYKSFVDLPRNAKLARMLAGAAPSAGLLASKLTSKLTGAAVGVGFVPPQTRWGKVADVLASSDDLVLLYQTQYGLFSKALASQLSTHPSTGALARSGLTDDQLASNRAAVGDDHSLHAISTLELISFVRERLVRDMDAASMAVSLELRVPFLDHVFIQEVAGLTEADRFLPLGRKDLLKAIAIDGLDHRIFDRPKSGFVLPIDRWCRGVMREQMTETYNNAELTARVGLNGRVVRALWRSFLNQIPGLYWSRVWAIFVLLDWCERHRVSL